MKKINIYQKIFKKTVEKIRIVYYIMKYMVRNITIARNPMV